MNSRATDSIRRFASSAIVVCLIVTVTAQPAYAISQNQINVLNQGIYFFNTEINTCYQPTAPGTAAAPTSLVGSDNKQKAFNFFVGNGLTPVQAAGILGNLMQESGINPNAEQVAGAWSDTSSAVDKGVGIAQWDGGRRASLINTAKSQGVDPKDLGFQLGYLWNELTTTYATVLQHVKASTTVEDAVNQFVGPKDRSGHPVAVTDEVARSAGYENPGKPQMNNRLSYALQISQSNGAAGASSASCAVSCSGSSNTTTANLSAVRQQVVCIASQELAAWTPPPSIPRMQYTKYTDGAICEGGNVPVKGRCPLDNLGNETNEQWCADFVSWVYKQAGDPFTGGTSGGWRLAAVAQVKALPGTDPTHFHWHPAGNYTPVPGDIAIHQGPNVSHVNIVVSVSGDVIHYIGGDQGSGPYGGPQSASVVSDITHTKPAGSGDDPIVGYVSPD